MKLSQVLQGTGIPLAGADPEITAVINDSRLAAPGTVFFALPGSKADGADFIAQALQKGASAVISAAEPPAELAASFPAATCLRTPDPLRALSRAAANFHGHPALRLRIFGITGTKGKTTTAYLLEKILQEAARKPGVIGTVDYRVDGKTLSPAANTTPLAHTLQELLARMADSGALDAVLEVSSHALALGRVEDVDFDFAVFTNLQSDHLDFHKDRENYFEAKARLFDLLRRSPKPGKFAVLNADDERAPELLRRLGGEVRALTFGIDKPADISAAGLRTLYGESVFDLTASGKNFPVRLRLLGRHNVYNALAAIAAAVAAGIPAEEAAAAAGRLLNVPGRLQRVEEGQDFTVFVDYAHTAAALQSVLEGLRQLPRGRIITVFGCGGDRDRTKRAPMGRAVCSLSDLAIITSDNPRSEDPLAILAEIEEGVAGEFSNYQVVPDRAEAIRLAVSRASSGDIVLIAGKGHETYQILKDRTIHFSDAETAAAVIRARRSANEA
ncbi:MAG: UDP-N-acetylmuramoyl-L-alanyl-D-glutamate--2,6-diaminopimelate ligase [Elusimicrobia bacterium]|nr:UDP-N-acetylmuramoyl-L-alanyl-D-glutamate--2,6-diaminopimelate ligase [Elusimicrobiota bacterium]